jgi:hypothetical protein
MPEPVQRDLLEQLKEFISKRQDMLLDRWARYDKSGDSENANRVLQESVGLDCVRWYLNDEEYRNEANRIFEILD